MIIFVIMLALSLISIPLVYYLFEKIGLKILFIIFYLLSFMFLLKNVRILNIDFSLMVIPYVVLLSILYIFKEKLSEKDIKKNLIMLLPFIVLLIILMILLILYNQSVTDIVTANLNRVIKSNIIMVLTYPVMTVISLYGTYKIYELIKKNNDILFINISLTTILVGIFDCIIFNMVSNIGIMDIVSSLKLGLGNYLLKIILSIIFIPVVSYIIKRKKGIR